MNQRPFTTRNIATGYLSLSTAKVVFMLSGLAIYFTLPRVLSAADFGNYGVVIGFLSVFNMMLVVGTIQTVAKFVSESPGSEPGVRAAAYKCQGYLGGGVSLLLFAGAPLAAAVFKDPMLILPIRIGATIPLFYSFYAVAIGSLNGRKEYASQAALDITFALIKTVLIIGGALVTAGTEGAVSGFLATSVLIMFVGFRALSRRDRPVIKTPFPVRRFLMFELSVMMLTLSSNLLTTLDLFLVKALATGDGASEAAGFYTAAQTFSRIPHILVIALAMVMFPLISSSTFDNDLERSRRTIKAAFRFPLVIIAPICIFLSSHAEPCLHIVYPAIYAAAVPALRMLGFAVLLLALYHLGITIITGSGRPWVSVTATVIGIICHASAGFVLVPALGMQGAVIAAIIGWSAAFSVCASFILRQFHALVSPWTVVRTLTAMLLTWQLLLLVPATGLTGLIVGFCTSVIIYWSLLWIMREISLTELSNILKKLSSR